MKLAHRLAAARHAGTSDRIHSVASARPVAQREPGEVERVRLGRHVGGLSEEQVSAPHRNTSGRCGRGGAEAAVDAFQGDPCSRMTRCVSAAPSSSDFTRARAARVWSVPFVS